MPFPVIHRAAGVIRLLFVLLVISLAAVPSAAQSGGGIDATGTGGNHTIQGRIYAPSGQRANARIRVKLEAPGIGELTVLADVNGSFTFTSLLAGSYTVVVDAGDEYETAREPVYIDRTRGRVANTRVVTVPIYLRPKLVREDRAQVGLRDASLARVPKPALDLYDKALASVHAGDGEKAVELLKKAIEIHSEFIQALSELGVQYLKLGQPEKAADALKSALRIDSEAFIPRLNYGIALLQKKKFDDSEKELRIALAKNGSSSVARLYLGIVLVSLQKYDESEKELQHAASSGRSDVGLAHYYLGGLYWRKREYSRAADELETYLKMVPDAAEAERIRTTINELRNKH